MPTGDVETYFEDGEWKNKRKGANRAFGIATTKDEAVAAGREVARRDRVEHIIKNRNGTTAERNTYGDNPRNIPGS